MTKTSFFVLLRSFTEFLTAVIRVACSSYIFSGFLLTGKVGKSQGIEEVKKNHDKVQNFVGTDNTAVLINMHSTTVKHHLF